MSDKRDNEVVFLKSKLVNFQVNSANFLLCNVFMLMYTVLLFA